jgi:hypothetical protein
MGINNHFWPTFQKKVFKIGRKSTGASAVILTINQFSAVSAQCAMEFQKKFMFLGTIFFSHAHSGLQSD